MNPNHPPAHQIGYVWGPPPRQLPQPPQQVQATQAMRLQQQQQQQLQYYNYYNLMQQQQQYSPHQATAEQPSNAYNPSAGTTTAPPRAAPAPAAAPQRSWKDVVNQGRPQQDPRFAPPQQQHLQQGQDAAAIPKSVSEYVFRAYATCSTGEQQDSMERALKMVINQAKMSGVLFTRNWDNFPVPIVLNQASRPNPQQQQQQQQQKQQQLQQLQQQQQQQKTKKGQKQDLAARLGEELGPAAKKKKKSEVVVSADLKRGSEKRAARFGETGAEKKKKKKKKKSAFFVVSEPELNEDGTVDLDSMRVVGTCETLEKRYLRLTSAPDPGTVRPVPVLRRTLDMLLTKWANRTEESTEELYLWLSDQFRSMRQDLTVQNVKTDFAVLVYEENARIALAARDMHEFNACQTQLWTLFQTVQGCTSVPEFTAYRILYFALTNNAAEMSSMLKQSSFLGFQDPTVWHAEQVRRATEDNSWVSLRRLAANPPNQSGTLIALLIRKVQVRMLTVLLRAYGKQVALQHVQRCLGFVEGGKEFFLSSLVLGSDTTMVDVTQSLRKIALTDQ